MWGKELGKETRDYWGSWSAQEWDSAKEGKNDKH